MKNFVLHPGDEAVKNKNLTYAIILAIICTFTGAFGQLLQKMGVDKLEMSLVGVLTNLELMSGIAFYIVGGVLTLYALKKAELSVVFPFFSLSFIWVAILSALVLKERIVFLHALGILVIILGVYLVGRGAKHD